MKIQIAFLAAIAALLAISTNASAKMKTLRIAIAGSCDVLDVNQFGNKWVTLSADPDSCETALGTGKMVKDKYDGKVATASLTVNNDPATSYYLEMQFPFVDGGKVRIFYSHDGLFYELLDSTYSVSRARMSGLGKAPSISSMRHAK
jgi:hypothetical protein